MKKIISAVSILALAFSLFSAFIGVNAAEAETVSNTVSGYVSAVSGDILVASQSKSPKIYVDENDFPGVVRAAGDLKSDIKSVTGAEAEIVNDASAADIIIGTIGKSEAVDGLIANGSVDVSAIRGEWEAFTLRNVDGKLVIAGADKRGTIYGIYDLSEKMGISPWAWWADVTPQHSDAIYVTLPENGYTEGAPSVKYRGIFINQEWNLNRWSVSLGENDTDYMNTATYEKVFELLLRLKANYMWPAMHLYSPAFNANPENAKKADEYGIVMSTSHCEMLLRNNMAELLDFQNRWRAANPDKKLYMVSNYDLKTNVAYDYTDVDASGNHVYNKEFLEAYWRERVRANKDYESNFTIGMRGVHDEPMNSVSAKTDAEKMALLEEIIAKQRQILSEELGKPAEEIPQTFIPYKEVADWYNQGLSVPDDVTLMFTNDNYGHIRQSINDTERARSGGCGIYYHVSYYGRPSSVLWNAGTQLGLIKEEMTKAYDNGAKTIWLVNVGPIKPFENQMEYFLDLGRNIDKMRNTKVADYVKDNARRYFGFNDAQAQEYSDIQCEFLENANARRPESHVAGIYSLTSYGDEGQKQVDKYDSLLKRSQALYDSLPEDKKPAFYELQLYAVKSADNIINNFVGADRSVLYKKQGRGGSVNKYAEQSASHGRTAVEADTSVYTTMLGGKWDKLINPFQTRLRMDSDKEIASAQADSVSELGHTDMGIAVENQDDTGTRPALEFSGYTKDIRFIDIFNTGIGSLDWKAAADQPWVIFNKTSGTVYDDDRIYAGIDWDNAPKGVSSANITITRYIGDNAVRSEQIEVRVNNDIKDFPEKTYAEANGYVSIETEHYTSSVTKDSYEWQEQDDFGRSGNSMKLMPNVGDSLSDNSVYLEYDVNFESTGTFNLDAYRMPTLNERGGVRFAVGIDDDTPTTLKGTNKFAETATSAWAYGILSNNETLTAKITVSEPGIHKIRLYGVDTGAVVDKMVITTGTKYKSFYGAPESYNTTYNNGLKEMTTDGYITGEEPKLVTDIENGTGIIAVYDRNGALVSVQTSDSYMDGAYTFNKAIAPAEDDIVKAMVWSSLEEMTPLSGVFGKSETKIYGDDNTMPEAKDAADKITGNVTALFEPSLYISGSNNESKNITSVDIIKTGETANARIAIAAYDSDGVMLGSKAVTHSFESAQINEKVTVPMEFAIPDGTAEIQVITYDSDETLNALSPVYTVDEAAVSLMAIYDGGVVKIKTELDSYAGMEAICRIYDSANETAYIRQETVDDKTFNSINTGELSGIYTADIGVAGKGRVAHETVNTAMNITRDNPESSKQLYSWDFSESTQVGTGKNIPVVSGNAKYDSDNQAVKMTSTDKSGGSMSVTFDEPVKAYQGQKITVTSKIAYGKHSGRYMNYMIKDSNGNELVRSQICMYSTDSGAPSIKIGGTEQLDGKLPDGIKLGTSYNEALKNGYSTYTTVLDPNSKTITLTISNKDGTSTFTGKFPEGTSYDLGTLNYSTTHAYAVRSCYVDDISVDIITEPSYTITFDAQDQSGNKVKNAQITVTDEKYGAVIPAESDGTYKLCDGVYSYTAAKTGYETAKGEFELSPASESKTISVTMNRNGDVPEPEENEAQITVRYRDEEDNEIKEDVVLTAEYEDGDTYTVPDELKKDFTVKTADGLYNLYTINSADSQLSAEYADQMVLTLKFNNTAQYDYYEDFENNALDLSKWRMGSGALEPTIEEDNSKYIHQTTGSTTTSGYMTFDEVNTTQKKVHITADVKFTAPTGSSKGNSQFSISNTSPSFKSNNINYALTSEYDGHIIVFEYIGASEVFTVNGKTLDKAFIGDWMHMEADVNFSDSSVKITVTNDSGLKAEFDDATIFSQAYASNIGSYFMRSAGAQGTVSADNITVKITGDGGPVTPRMQSVINNKSVYAFGDSIVYGHTAPKQSFMRLMADDYALDLNMMAVNGARVIPNDAEKDIIYQINKAPAEAPDIVVFDGYTNDAYGDASWDSFNTYGRTDIMTILGEAKGPEAADFDDTTFCGAFEKILYTMKQKWPQSKLVFIVVHKSGARNVTTQTKLRELTMQMCEEWGVEIVDMFTYANADGKTLDTTNSAQMKQYIMGGNGSHPNVTACRAFYIPAVAGKLESLCGEDEPTAEPTTAPTAEPTTAPTDEPTAPPAEEENKWDFSEYNGDSAVTATANLQEDYRGLEIHLASGDSITEEGLCWSKASGIKSDAKTTVTNNRYMIYKANENGNLLITYKGSAAASNKHPMIYVSCGDSLACTTKEANSSQLEPNQRFGDGSTEFQTASFKLTEGMTYYIWGYYYNDSNNQFTISDIAFVPAQATVSTRNIYSSNMLLQRDEPFVIDGKADAADEVSVTLINTTNNETVQTVTSETVSDSGSWIDKDWSVTFDAVSDYDSEYQLVISADGAEDLVYENILFGDVYMFSGQSNMWEPVSYYVSIDSAAYGSKALNKHYTDKIRVMHTPGTSDTGTAVLQYNARNAQKWRDFSKYANISDIAAPAYTAAVKMYEETGVPIGVIDNAYPGAYISSWFDSALAIDACNLGKNGTFNERNWYCGRIYPLRNLRLSGVFWYQGEADSATTYHDNPYEYYSEMLPRLIETWRELFKDDTLPFYYVQLARIGSKIVDENNPDTGTVGEMPIKRAQTDVYLNMEDKTNIGVIGTLDLYGYHTAGQKANCRTDIHLGQKNIIGDRMAAYAFKDIYNMSEYSDGSTVYSHGPIYQSSVIQDGKIVVTFDCSGQLSIMPSEQYTDTTGEEKIANGEIDPDILNEFEVAGEDGIWYAAVAEITANDQVTVFSDEVPEPIKVRYCGMDYPESPNLTDASGMPSYVFEKTAENAE